MYDTLHLRLSKEEAGGNLLNCLPYLSNVAETYRQDGQTFLTGYANNCKVSISDYGLSIKGSIAKFYSGNNLHTLSISDSKMAFEMMADTLRMPIRKATVSRIDIAQNLLMNYKPEAYYNFLGESNYYQRLVQPKSVYYSNSRRTKLFYNKIAESKKQGCIIPETFQNKHVLRYELRYTTRLKKQFNQAIITPDTLTDNDFYMKLMDQWVKEYTTIQKIGLVNMDTKNIRSPKDYFKQLLALTIQEKGSATLLQHVDLLREQNTFDKPEYYSRVRSEIKRLSSCKPLADTPELIQELNDKIAQAKQNYR